MVYQDYELIATKRVSHSRGKGSIYAKQYFTALGGLNTVYTTAFFGMAGGAFGATSAPALSRPLMNATGMASVARASLIAGGPAIFGLVVGVGAFGNSTELRRLMRNGATFRREMTAV